MNMLILYLRCLKGHVGLIGVLKLENMKIVNEGKPIDIKCLKVSLSQTAIMEESTTNFFHTQCPPSHSSVSFGQFL